MLRALALQGKSHRAFLAVCAHARPSKMIRSWASGPGEATANTAVPAPQTPLCLRACSWTQRPHGRNRGHYFPELSSWRPACAAPFSCCFERRHARGAFPKEAIYIRARCVCQRFFACPRGRDPARLVRVTRGGGRRRGEVPHSPPYDMPGSSRCGPGRSSRICPAFNGSKELTMQFFFFFIL